VLSSTGLRAQLLVEVNIMGLADATVTCIMGVNTTSTALATQFLSALRTNHFEADRLSIAYLPLMGFVAEDITNATVIYQGLVDGLVEVLGTMMHALTVRIDFQVCRVQWLVPECSAMLRFI
jgi:hypothetical protein